MTVKVITTLHQDGYNLYGKESLDSWATFFPSDWKIFYYAEKHEPALSERVTVLDFDKECANWQKFYDHVKNKSHNLSGRELNWYKKALRWSFKMFALLHALENTNDRFLIWMDADVFATHSPRKTWISESLGTSALAAWMQYLSGGSHVESGVLIIDMLHPDTKTLKDWIYKGYVDYAVLNEKKAWDGFWLAKLLETGTMSWKDVKMVSLNKRTDSLHWLNHRAGTEKFLNKGISSRSGRTEQTELLKEKS